METPELKTLSKSLLPEQAPRLSLSMRIWEGWDPKSGGQQLSQWKRGEAKGSRREGLGEREAPFCLCHLVLSAMRAGEKKKRGRQECHRVQEHAGA